MQVHNKQTVGRILILILIMLLALSGHAATQQSKSLVVSGNGAGSIKVGRDTYKVYAVVAKLLEDGTAEINLVSDLTIFVSAKWVSRGDVHQEIDLQITGGAANSSLEGTGKLFLSEDRKSLASLKMQGVNRASKKDIEVSFVAK